MTFKKALACLSKAKDFKEWKAGNEKAFLSYGFLMEDPQIKEEWQIGYYNPETEKLASFSIGDNVIRNPESEMFSETKKVLPVLPEALRVTADEALTKAEKLQKEKYPLHTPFKKILLLQTLDMGQVWNITYVTNTFKTLNIKIDSTTGSVLKYDLLDIFKMDK
jgi:hypothetical protein